MLHHIRLIWPSASEQLPYDFSGEALYGLQPADLVIITILAMALASGLAALLQP